MACLKGLQVEGKAPRRKFIHPPPLKKNKKNKCECLSLAFSFSCCDEHTQELGVSEKLAVLGVSFWNTSSLQTQNMRRVM